MSNERTNRLRTDDALTLLGAGMLALGCASALAWFGFGVDTLRFEGFGIQCVFHALTGFECPGCGMTRALLLASQLQWSEAWRMNPLLLPLLAVCAAGAARGIARRISDA